MRMRNIEFRWSELNKKYELIRWYKDKNDKEFCCVVAFFDEQKDGYFDMRTVGGRFFEDKDAFIVGKHAIEFLNDMFYEMKKEEELE